MLSLATFNLKDFFPQPPHEFAPKVACVAEMLARVDADVVALQEVGAPDTLEALLSRLDRRGGYGAPIVGTADARGIRCALLSRVPVLRSRVHTAESLPFPVFQMGDKPPFGARIPLRRGVVVAQIDGGALGAIDVIVAHFKSRRWVPLRDGSGNTVQPVTARDRADAELRSLVWRAAEALCVRGLVDEALAARPEANVAVMGDLNDGPDSTSVVVVRGSDLSSAADLVAPAQRFSMLHQGERTQLDHILLSPALRAKLSSAHFFNEELREHASVATGVTPAAAPTNDSDHAPFVARFD